MTQTTWILLLLPLIIAAPIGVVWFIGYWIDCIMARTQARLDKMTTRDWLDLGKRGPRS